MANHSWFQWLGTSKISHITEIRITIPSSNAETEVIFLYLENFSKEQSPLEDENQGNHLRLQNDIDIDFTVEWYKHVAEWILTHHPYGQIGKAPWHPAGYTKTNCKKVK